MLPKRLRQIAIVIRLFTSVLISLAVRSFAADSPIHTDTHVTKPQPWPGGIIPYDISKLTPEQQAIVKRGMQRWMDTGAQISFVPWTNEEECTVSAPLRETAYLG
jgi:hypothetical protein